IELEEIAAVLRQHPAVEDAVVVGRREGGAVARLDAYVVNRPASLATAAELRAFAAGKLPPYMVPAQVVELVALPLTPSGKIDRQALPSSEAAPAAARTGATGGGDLVTELLASLWAEALGVPRAGADDDFFAQGGHSLLATRLIARIRQAFGIDLPLRQLFATPSLAGVAVWLRGALGRQRQGELPPLAAGLGGESPPLSFAQERIWFMSQLDPDSPAWNIAAAIRLEGPLDPGALGAALQAVVRRHDVVRASFSLEGQRPVQQIHPAAGLRVPRIDLRRLAAAAREAELLRLAAEHGERPIDLGRAPLLRAALLALGEASHALLLTLHHIAADGGSLDVLMREVQALYGARRRGEAPALPRLPLQYGDFAAWQRSWLNGERLAAQLGYWDRRLARLPALELRADRPRSAAPSFRGATRGRRLPERLAGELGALGRREGATLFLLLVAGFKALLHCDSGQQDLVLGMDVANRGQIELEGLMGCFVNQLALRTSLAGDPTFRELLARVREGLVDAYGHQDLPFEKLVEALRPRRSPAAAPLFQVKLNLQGRPDWSELLPGLTATLLPVAGRAAQLDLILNLETGRGFELTAEYSTDRFEAATIDRLLGRFELLLELAAARPEARLSELAAALEEASRRLAQAARQDARDELSRKLKSVRRRQRHDPPPGAAAEPAAQGRP
ncbi:MAG: non-ribosomal peptide synthetase, partial [Acidobacteria bacterium]|nr:non-ribosomal peptide synthetase [Acidobacteriota bacterium]